MSSIVFICDNEETDRRFFGMRSIPTLRQPYGAVIDGKANLATPLDKAQGLGVAPRTIRDFSSSDLLKQMDVIGRESVRYSTACVIEVIGHETYLGGPMRFDVGGVRVGWQKSDAKPEKP